MQIRLMNSIPTRPIRFASENSQIPELTDADFEQQVLRAPKDTIVMVRGYTSKEKLAEAHAEMKREQAEFQASFDDLSREAGKPTRVLDIKIYLVNLEKNPVTAAKIRKMVATDTPMLSYINGNVLAMSG